MIGINEFIEEKSKERGTKTAKSRAVLNNNADSYMRDSIRRAINVDRDYISVGIGNNYYEFVYGIAKKNGWFINKVGRYDRNIYFRNGRKHKLKLKKEKRIKRIDEAVNSISRNADVVIIVTIICSFATAIVNLFMRS